MSRFDWTRRKAMKAAALGVLGGVTGAASAGDDGDGNEGDGSDSCGEGRSRTLIEDGTIVTMDEDLGIVEEGSLLIEGGEIVDVGEDVDGGDADVLDASEMIVTPGLVNTHTHMWQTGIRGIAGDMSLTDYFVNVHSAVRPHYEPEDVYIANLVGALELMNRGVTTAMDWSHALHTFDHAERAVDALSESGLRSVFAHAPPGAPEWWDNSELEHPEDEVRRIDERLADEDLVSLGMAIRGPAFSTEAVTDHDLELAHELDAIATMHIGAPTYEGPEDHGIPRLADEGLLDSNVNLVHANGLEDEHFEAVVDAGASVSITPEVEMQMGHGAPATGAVLDAGGAPTLGTDIVSSTGADMLYQARFALQTERGLRNVAALEEGEIRESLDLTVRDAFEWATLEGARALGLDDETGSLTPGKRADVVLFETDGVNTTPVNDPLQTVLLHADSGNVDTVFVDGVPVKEDGELTYPDADERREELAESGEDLLEAAGFDE